MGLVWNPWAIPFIVGALVQYVVAIFTIVARPKRLLNQALATVFVAGAMIHAGVAVATMSTTAPLSYSATAFAQIGKQIVGPIYLIFLGAALDTPLVAPLRNRIVRWALVLTAVIGTLAVLARPELFVGEPVRHEAYEFGWDTAPIATTYDRIAAIAFFFGLLASISAFRRATPGTPNRQRAKLFLIAFGARDAGLVSVIVATATVMERGSLASDVLYHFVLIPTVIAFVLIVAYGILRWHLFDLDIKIKWGLRRGVLAGTFLAVFLVVSKLAENLLSGTLGLVAGGVAAGLLLFALTPLQRAAERLANAAMPRVSETDEYLAHRRVDVYKGTLQELFVDGVISPKERAALARLQAQLGIRNETAAAIERDLILTSGKPLAAVAVPSPTAADPAEKTP